MADDAEEEKERERLLREARHALRAREDLLAIVSHDLRNPLGVVRLNATMIEQLAPDDAAGDRLRKYAQSILGAVDRMTRLVSDLLDLSRIEAGQLLSITPKLEDASELAKDTVEIFAPLARARKVTLKADLPRGPCPLFCDAARLHEIFSNLIDNAIRFTREGGTVTVRVRKKEGEIAFSVSDTGVGIPEDELRNIFDAYWQAQATRQSGVGIGLSIAKGLVEAHGGRIWAESKEGRGSTFHFVLPAPNGSGDPGIPG